MKERSYVTYSSLCKIHFFHMSPLSLSSSCICVCSGTFNSANILCNSLLFCLKCSEIIYRRDRIASDALHHILYRYLQSILGFQNTTVSWYRHKFNLCLSRVTWSSLLQLSRHLKILNSKIFLHQIPHNWTINKTSIYRNLFIPRSKV
jgi:hypothetical protein